MYLGKGHTILGNDKSSKANSFYLQVSIILKEDYR
jgi:hypothetical protein